MELQNPIADTELPTWKVSDQTNDVRAPSIEEVRSLLISAKRLGARIYAYILLIAGDWHPTWRGLRDPLGATSTLKTK